MKEYSSNELILSQTISDNLRNLRASKDSSKSPAKKLTQEEIAENIGLETTSYKNYEAPSKGHSRSCANLGMSVLTLYKIAKFYGVSADYILGLADCPSISQDEQIAQKTIGINHVAMRKLMSWLNTPYRKAFEELLSSNLLPIVLEGIERNTENRKRHLKRLMSEKNISERDLYEIDYSARHSVRDTVDDIHDEMNRLFYDSIKGFVSDKLKEVSDNGKSSSAND